MAAISPMPKFRVRPPFIPYYGPPAAKSRKRAAGRKEARAPRESASDPYSDFIDIDDIFSDIEESTAAKVPVANCSGDEGNPIEIGSDTDDDGAQDDSEDDDCDLPPLGDLLLRRSAGPYNNDAADEAQRAITVTRPSSPRRSPTPSNGYNSDPDDKNTEADKADNGSGDNFRGEADGAGGGDGDEGAQTAAHPQSGVLGPAEAAAKDGGCGDISEDHVDGVEAIALTSCGQGVGGGALGDYGVWPNPPVSLQAERSRKRQYESVGPREEHSGELSYEHGTRATHSSRAGPNDPSLAEKMEVSPPRDIVLSGSETSQTPEKHVPIIDAGSMDASALTLSPPPSLTSCGNWNDRRHSPNVCDKDDESGISDTSHRRSLEPMSTDLYPNKRRRTAQVSLHSGTTISGHQLEAACETTHTSSDSLIVGSEFLSGVATDKGRTDKDTSIPTNNTHEADAVKFPSEDSDLDDAAPHLDDVERQQGVSQLVNTVAPCSTQDPAGLRHDTTPQQLSPTLDNVNNQKASGSVVSMHQTSSTRNEDYETSHERQKSYRARVTGHHQWSSSKLDGKDGLARLRRSRGPSSRRFRRSAAGVEDGQTFGWSREIRSTRLNRVDASGDELEQHKSPLAHRRPERRGVDAPALRGRDMRDMAGRKLPKPHERHSHELHSTPSYYDVGCDRETQHDDADKHTRMAPIRVVRVTHVTIRPVSRCASMLIAVGRSDVVPMRYDDEVASAIEDVIGPATKLTSISIDPLPPGAWILIGLVCELDEEGDVQISDKQLTAQASQAKKRLSRSALRLRPRPHTRNVSSGGEDQQSSGDDGSSSDGSDASSNWQEPSQECGANGDSDEESDGLGDSGWKSRHIKGSKWEDSEDGHLRVWVAQDARPKWKAIYRRFPKRTNASVCLRGHKIRTEMAKGGKQGD